MPDSEVVVITGASAGVGRATARAFGARKARVGLLVALVGVFCAHMFQNPYFDGGASICIGIILAAVAVVLAYQTKSLLIGAAVDPETLKDIRRIAESDGQVESVRNALTMYFGPHTILLAMDLRFRPDLSAAEVEESIDRLEQKIRSRYPDVKHIFVESESVSPQRRRKASYA
jgi:divalent metal cation (Fe/Co/Zn/Cd) transporter